MGCKDIMITPVVVRTRNIVSKFEKWVQKLEINVSVPLHQKACLLGTGKILRNVFNIYKMRSCLKKVRLI